MKLGKGKIIFLHAMKATEMQTHTFLILPLDVGEWPASVTAQRAPYTHRT